MIAVEYTCYGGGRCSNTIKTGIAESVCMIRGCFIEKVVKTSGEIRGCTGIWSYGLGAGRWGECFRHHKDEVVEDGRACGMWGTGSLWGLVAFTVKGVETEQATEARPLVFLHFRLKCRDSIMLHLFPNTDLNLGLNVNTSLDTWGCWIPKQHLLWTAVQFILNNLKFLLTEINSKH